MGQRMAAPSRGGWPGSKPSLKGQEEDIAEHAHRRRWPTLTDITLPMVLLSIGSPVQAQSTLDLPAIEAEVEALRMQQAQTTERMARLEAALAAARAGQTRSAVVQPGSTPIPNGALSTVGVLANNAPAAAINLAGGSPPGTVPTPASSRLTLNGDFRLRFKTTARTGTRAIARSAYCVHGSVRLMRWPTG